MKQLEERMKEVLWEVFKSFKECQAILYPFSSPLPFFTSGTKYSIIFIILLVLFWSLWTPSFLPKMWQYFWALIIHFPEDPFNLKSDKDWRDQNYQTCNKGVKCCLGKNIARPTSHVALREIKINSLAAKNKNGIVLAASHLLHCAYPEILESVAKYNWLLCVIISQQISGMKY